MSAPPDRDALFAERMRLVLALGEANAAHHRAQARAAGAQIEVMHAERPDADATGAAREAAAASEAAALRALDEAEARVGALDDRLAALDRDIAATAT